ncbi:interferon-inducible double-stranded RNA-dependent protein kinase activator A-like [Lingula anatina]|uniref:Interferon-inducible double-stranded RNA-dependent protein kinase activator A-like n=1 Tax=Lingula anatina TaxID=7574 RepID=A0A1S3K7T8_LINAN|nr:interferon-inducible double-stranded RNA-dependent protein kinase activator A-like [Lingula anatina]|eukprot:XP_013418700.1 interferon-inducible double-stranded RNA-dependent protein kinase activator A-like [Lingula anatina]
MMESLPGQVPLPPPVAAGPPSLPPTNQMQNKTPISLLQEICTKRGITPQYDLIANEGAVHEPTFVFRASAGGFTGTGKGPSKKKAKHNAARAVLNQMMGQSSTADTVVYEPPQSSFICKKLNGLHTTSLNTPASNFCQLLQEIAEEQCFEVTYVDLQELSNKGNRQCLVQLSTMPVAVCHGSGPTSDECHANAAHNALQYLKIMTKKA